MNLSPLCHQSFLKEFISAAKIPNKQERGQVRKQFKQKLSHHINMLHFNQIRQDRFALAQQAALQKQTDSLQRTKQFLQLKQQKAQSNKAHSLLERSKKAEGDLARWEKVVGQNRQKYQRQLQEAKQIIKLWNEKLSQSTIRKNEHLEDLTKNLKQKMELKERRIMTLRLKGENSPLSENPERFDSLRTSPKQTTRRQSRVSTQGFLQRRKKQEEEMLKESIIRTVGKEQRINQARYMRHYLQERRRKQNFDKEEILKAMHYNNLSALRGSQQQRSQIIERRLSKDRVIEERPKKQRGSVSVKAVINGFGEREEEVQTSEMRAKNCNYGKLMTEKLKEISIIMRKHRRQL